MENGNTQMVRTTMAIPIDIGGGQVAKINLPPGATLAGPVKVLTLPNQQTIAHVTVMAPPGIVEKYVAEAAAESEAAGGDAATPKALSAPSSVTPPSTVPPIQTTSQPRPNAQATSSIKTPAQPALVSPRPATDNVPIQASSSQSTTAPANLFDNLSNKPSNNIVAGKSETKISARPKVRSSSSDDDLPLSRLSSQKAEPKKASIIKKEPIPKKPPSEKAVDKSITEKKPQTGFGAFLEEKRPELLQKSPHISEKELAKEVKNIWDSLDIPKKNHYIRNSDAYKLKKGIITNEQLSRNEKKATKGNKPTVASPSGERVFTPPVQSKSEASSKKPDNGGKQDASGEPGYHHPKRNIKRKFFDVDEDYDLEDADWTMPAPDVKAPSHDQHSGMPTSLPPLKFKKKSKQPPSSDENYSPRHPKVDKMLVNDDIDLPSVMDIEDKPSEPPPISHKKAEALKRDIIKESTPPPPLRKIENAVPQVSTERKSNLKLICLHEGCYEEATTESDRGKYWCSNKCCILYSKVIFNAWLGARRANMID